MIFVKREDLAGTRMTWDNNIGGEGGNGVYRQNKAKGSVLGVWGVYIETRIK